eukprot:g12195.t1
MEQKLSQPSLNNCPAECIPRLAADLPWVSLWRIFMASAVLMCLGCSSLFGGQAEMDQALLLFLAWSIVRLFLRHHGP